MSENNVESELRRQERELQAAAGTGGTIIDAVAKIIPWPLLILCVLLFAGFYGFKMYQGAQLVAAQTKVKEATAALQQIEARRRNATNVDGETLTLAEARAKLDLAQKKAVLAKNEADTLTAEIDGESARLKQARAELAKKSAEADATKVRADASTQRDAELRTIEDRIEEAKYMINTLKAFGKKTANVFAIGHYDCDPLKASEMELRAACVDNPYAEYVNCPARFITRHRPVFQRAGTPPAQAPQAPVPQPAAATKPAPVNFAVVANVKDYLTLRPCPMPTDECPELARMARGTRVKLLGPAAEREGWWKVEVTQGAKALTGFVNGKYLVQAN